LKRQIFEETIVALERYLLALLQGQHDRVLVWSDGSITGPDPAMDQGGLEVVAEFRRSKGPFTRAELEARVAAHPA